MSTSQRAGLRPAPASDAVALGALWLGLVGAPAAWTVQELVGSPLVGAACHPAPALGQVMSTPTARALSLALSLLALAVGLLALWTAVRSWRKSAQEEGESRAGHVLEIGEGRARFMALAGILLSAVFSLAIVLNAVPLFLIPLCVGTP